MLMATSSNTRAYGTFICMSYISREEFGGKKKSGQIANQVSYKILIHCSYLVYFKNGTFNVAFFGEHISFCLENIA